MSEDNKIQIWKQERWIPQTSVYANEQMRCQRICHAILDASHAVMQRCTRKNWAKHVHTSMHTITASFNCLTLRSIEAQSCRGSGWYLSRHADQNWSCRLSGSSVSPLFSALIIGMSFQYADFIISQPDLHEKLLYASWLLVSCYCWDHQHYCIPVGLERLHCVFYKSLIALIKQ